MDQNITSLEPDQPQRAAGDHLVRPFREHAGEHLFAEVEKMPAASGKSLSSILPSAASHWAVPGSTATTTGPPGVSWFRPTTHIYKLTM